MYKTNILTAPDTNCIAIKVTLSFKNSDIMIKSDRFATELISFKRSLV